MWPFSASRQHHELIPIIRNFALTIRITARPIFLKVMEYCFTCVILANLITLLFICKCSNFATFIRANKSAILIQLRFLLDLSSRHSWWYHRGYLSCSLFFILLFLVKVRCCFNPYFVLLDTCLGIVDSLWLPEFSGLSFIWMRSCAAAWYFLELVPVIHYFVAAFPPFLDVMENRFPRVESAWITFVLGFVILLTAPRSFAL